MNGSRSTPPRHGDRSSLDALSRTIEGLEARIEGLMGAAPRDPRQRPAPPERDQRPDPLAEIRQRQRALEATRERLHPRPEREQPAESRSRSYPDARTETRSDDYRASREPRRPAASTFSQPMPAADPAIQEIARSLVGLRQELKQDISEGVSREIGALRAEIRSIKASAPDMRFADDIRDDLGRLADAIARIGQQTAPVEAEGLRTEFEELRSLMDGLAREDSVRRMETRWTGVEDKFRGFNPGDIQDDMVTLAYRLDDIKSQLHGMTSNKTIQALEDKLMSIAAAMEQIGARVQPNDRAMAEQFAGLDIRLDEISRAIVAGNRSTGSTQEQALLQRLDNRIADLAEQIDIISHEASMRREPADELASRIEALTQRVSELTSHEAATRLDERLEQLSMLLERSQKAPPSPELTGYLADISRKIDALEQGSVNDRLAERLDMLARRIDDMEFRPAAPSVDDGAFLRLEERLGDIAARLDETATAPQGDHLALRGLEEQIAHLSLLISEPRPEATDVPPALEGRMAAIEDYMATNDEYIIEAARQAAEAVVEAYSRNGSATIGQPSVADMSTLAALADDLRHLEELGRNSEERTHRTFEALHETLVQIAERLDHMDNRIRAPEAAQETAREEAPRDFGRAMPKTNQPLKAPQPAFAEADESYEFDDAELAAYPPRDDASAASSIAAPIIRTLQPAAETPSIDVNAAVADIVAQVEVERATTKGGLLAGMKRKLLGSGRNAQATPERAFVDPTPPIDPVDAISTEEDNQLLEPGSGGPDIKKILERVRASQQAQRDDGDADKADYIAAARRAAQAAAQEVDHIQRFAPAGEERAKAGTSAFSRHRRPILMAIGAVLLAMMSLPLVNTLTRGEKAPPVIDMNSTAATSPSLPVAPAGTADEVASEAVAPQSPAGEPKPVETAATAPATTETAPTETTVDAGKAATSHLTATAPLGGEATVQTMSPAEGAAATVDTAAFVSDDAAPAATAPEIVVPLVIEPASLAEAARGGDPLALFEIAARYTDGRGVEANAAEAAVWYKLSADRGFAPAQYRLANLYEKGTGVARDFAKARQYYSQAAENGNTNAMHNLAVLLASGNDGAPDFDNAVRWFTEAAEHGVADSQFNLAILYARGNGVEVDLEESYKWFAIAANNGDKDAAEKRDEVAKAMRPEQVESARAKVAAWKVKAADANANSAIIPDEWAGKGPKTASVDMKKAIRNIQAILNNNGFDAGKPDGEMGKKTISAIKAFQVSIGQEPTGKVSDQLVRELLARNK